MLNKSIPTIVLGGSGYVAAECLGLLLNHPYFRIESVVSTSQVGTRIDEVFPHLTGVAEDLTFTDLESAKPRLAGKRQVALFSAMPHGETARVLEELLAGGTSARVVDISADFRTSDAAEYEQIYGKPHEGPTLLPQFHFGLPDLDKETPEAMISHPGCFTTGITLAIAPLVANQLIEPQVQVSAITGSTGAGRQLGAGTHHPHRQSSMWAYQPLVHRHTPEIRRLLQAHAPDLTVAFVPHSGPFARGIHATCFATLRKPMSTAAVTDLISAFYAHTPFVKVAAGMPTLKEIVGSNRCHLGVAVSGNQVVITSVIDNLVKGAAGGAVQWMNRLFSLDEKEGLVNAVPGWI
ncbi:MAG: N-acetyl-gamma-glutamyl-phosphate reductase [Chthonomonas sp.]|nr:N-acetyl-gamma-glutamyl-phosphate reductase [Chthonomonas sp.]